MGLPDREVISIVQLIVYFPILLVSAFVTFRHGLRRDLGWIYLTIFSIARIVGAILFIIIESESRPSTGLQVAALVIQSAALSPLMLATAGFLGVVAQGADLEVNRYPFSRFLHLPLLAGLIIGIIAGTDSTDPKKVNEAITLKKVSAILFLVAYVAFVLLHGYFWVERRKLQLRRRTLLLGISCALPFLGARLAYSLGGAFSSAGSIFLLSPNDSTITHNSIILYGLLAVLSEFIVVLDYTVIGIILPLDKDLKEGALEKENRKWRPNAYGGYRGQSMFAQSSPLGGNGYNTNGNGVNAGKHSYPPHSH